MPKKSEVIIIMDYSMVPTYFFSGYRTHSNLSVIFLLFQSGLFIEVK